MPGFVTMAKQTALHTLLGLFIILAIMMPVPALADEFLFFNGDKIYGQMKGFSNGSFVVDVEGAERQFPISQVRKYTPESNGPTAAESLAARTEPADAEMVQNASGAVTATEPFKFKEQEVKAEIEKGFTLRLMMLNRYTEGFFRRTGAYLQGSLQNDSGFDYRGVDFRAYLLDEEGNTITSQDFYIFRFPQGSFRPFAIRMPGVPLERVKHVKIVRRF